MSIKIKQLESGLALLQWLEGLGDLGGIIYVKDGKLVITLPIEGTVVEGGTDLSDMATKTWVTEILENFTGGTVPEGVATLNDIPTVKVTPLQLSGTEIATVAVDDKVVTLRCDLSTLATLISPAFLGFPTAPMPGSLSDDDSIATTAFVKKVLRLITGIDVNKIIRDNMADLMAELLERYNKLQGTNTVLETTIRQLLSKIANPDVNPADIQDLILQVQQLIAQQEAAEHLPMSDAQRLAVKLRNNDPIADVDLAALAELLLRYAAAGSQNADINAMVSSMLLQDVTATACNNLKAAVENYLTNIFSQTKSTRKDIEDYLDTVQDVLAIIQRLLTVYKGLPSSTPAINTAVKNLNDALIAGAAKEELKEKALILENLLRQYDYSSYGLSADDKDLESKLRDLETRLADVYARISAAADGSTYAETYTSFFTLLETYSASGETSVEILLLLEKLAAALEKLKQGDTDPTLPTTVTQTITLLTPLLEGGGFSVDDLMALLLEYRKNNGDSAAVAELLTILHTFLENGDTNNGAATDKTATDLITKLQSVLSDIKTLREELARKQQEEIDKKTGSIDEENIIKTIKELSAAINNDPKFYETVMTLINSKLDSSGGTVSGDLSVTGNLFVTGTVTGNVTGDVTGTSDKAVKDVNGKNIVDYVNNVAVNNTTLTVTKGSGSSTSYQLPVGGGEGGGGSVIYQPVTDEQDGLARKEDYTKLKGIEAGANNYTLPQATSTVLGGVMIGDNITNQNGKISVMKTDVTTALGYEPADKSAVDSSNTALESIVKSYVKSVDLLGQTLTITDGNGKETTFTTQDTTYNVFTGATSTKAGTPGTVLAPAKGYNNRYLKGDGSWSKISASDIEGYVPGSGSGGGGGGSVDLSDYLKTDIADVTYAPINSPKLTGTPKSVTPASTDNSTTIATTAFVQSLLSNKQPLHAALTSISGLTTAADKMIYTTAANKYAVTALTSAARILLSKTSVSAMCDYLNVLSGSGTAAEATKLASAKTIRTNLASTTAVGFDGSKDITPGVTGTLPVANGGTGQSLTAAPSLLVNLASKTAAGIFTASPRPGVTGTLPVANGGTGQTSLSDVIVGKAEKLKTAVTISLTGGVTGSVSFDGSKNVSMATSVSAAEKSPAYGKCTTAAGTAAKEVDIPDFTLVDGARIAVNFKEGNTAKSPTLNVSKTGAKPMSLAPGEIPSQKMFVADITGQNSIVKGRIVDLTYTSGQWVVSRSNIFAHSLISGIFDAQHWGGFITTCYGISVPGEGNMLYGICTTAASTGEKTVTCPELKSAPADGTVILVHMRNGNSHASPTFNVNNKGAFVLTGPSGIKKRIPKQANIYLVYVDASTSSDSAGRWSLGKITFENYMANSDIFQVDTAAGTADKGNTITYPRERNYVHTNGGRLIVNFAETNTANNPTLNINGYGKKYMYWPDGTKMTKGDITKGLWEFVYRTSPEGYVSTRDKSAGSVTSVTNAAKADTATKLASAVTVQTNLASTTAASFDGSAGIKPGVTGTLPVANGGTGATSLANITVGNATTATKLKTAQKITLTGAVTGSATFDGSAETKITTTAGSSLTASAISGATTSKATAIAGATNMKSGYVNFGTPYNNLKLQWTIANFSGTNKYVDCTFPTEFTTACYSVMISSGDSLKTTTKEVNNAMHYTFVSATLKKTGVRITRVQSDSKNTSYGDDWVCVWAIGV